MPGRATMMGQALLEAQPSGRSKWGALAFSLAQLLLIAAVDYFSGYEVQIAVVYLVPIFYAATRIGRPAGLVFAGLSSLAGIGSDLLAGERYSS